MSLAKCQIIKAKYQINFKIQSRMTKLHWAKEIWNLKNWSLKFICYLYFEIWNFTSYDTLFCTKCPNMELTTGKYREGITIHSFYTFFFMAYRSSLILKF
jgi:hypothetical protein